LSPPTVSEPAPADPVPSYHYAPQPPPAAKGNLVAASFSDAATASEASARANKSVLPGKIQTGARPSGQGQAADGKMQTGQLGTGHVRSASLEASDAAASYARLIDVTQPIEGETGATQVDGTRTFISASVGANPLATAARYVARVLEAVPGIPAGQTIEAFQIGAPPGAHANGGSGTIVADPLREKILAGVGPLGNSLALP